MVGCWGRMSAGRGPARVLTRADPCRVSQNRTGPNVQTRASTGILAPADKLPNCLAHARPTDQRGCIIWPQRLNSRAWTQGRSCLAGRRLQPRLPADALAQPVCATGARHAKQAVERLLGRVLFENFRAQRRPWQSWDWRLGADRRQSKCEPAEGVPADIYCSPRKVGLRV